jgi:hypothetical protein
MTALGPRMTFAPLFQRDSKNFFERLLPNRGTCYPGVTESKKIYTEHFAAMKTSEQPVAEFIVTMLLSNGQIVEDIPHEFEIDVESFEQCR